MQEKLDNPEYNEYLLFDVDQEDCEPVLWVALDKYHNKHRAAEDGLSVEAYLAMEDHRQKEFSKKFFNGEL